MIVEAPGIEHARKSTRSANANAPEPEKTAAKRAPKSTAAVDGSGEESTRVPVPAEPGDAAFAALTRELDRARRERRWVDADEIAREIDAHRAARPLRLVKA